MQKQRPKVNDSEQPRLMSLRQARELLCLSEHTIRAMIERGFLHVVKFGSISRVRREDVERLAVEGCPNLEQTRYEKAAVNKAKKTQAGDAQAAQEPQTDQPTDESTAQAQEILPKPESTTDAQGATQAGDVGTTDAQPEAVQEASQAVDHAGDASVGQPQTQAQPNGAETIIYETLAGDVVNVQPEPQSADEGVQAADMSTQAAQEPDQADASTDQPEPATASTQAAEVLTQPEPQADATDHLQPADEGNTQAGDAGTTDAQSEADQAAENVQEGADQSEAKQYTKEEKDLCFIIRQKIERWLKSKYNTNEDINSLLAINSVQVDSFPEKNRELLSAFNSAIQKRNITFKANTFGICYYKDENEIPSGKETANTLREICYEIKDFYQKG